MKVTYNKSEKAAAVDYIRENNPHVTDPEYVMNNLIQTATKVNRGINMVSCGGIHISITQEREEFSDKYCNEIFLDFYVSPRFGLIEEDDYVTEQVTL